MSFLGMLKDTVSITRQSESISSRKKVMTSASVATGIACLIQELTGDLAMTVMGRLPESTHIIFFKGDQDVLENDIINDGADDYLARQVAIIDRPGTAHHKEVIAEKRTD